MKCTKALWLCFSSAICPDVSVWLISWQEPNTTFVLAGLRDSVGSNWKLVHSRDCYYPPVLPTARANIPRSAVSYYPAPLIGVAEKETLWDPVIG